MAAVKTPRFVAFDSSHLGAWALDWASSDAVQRARSQAFEAQLDETGWVPLVCWHHLEELLNHTEAVVERRVEFLCGLPVVGWVAHRGGEAFPGGIIDLVGAELQAVLDVPDRTVGEVRESARGSILRVGTGGEAFGGFKTIWRDLLPHLREHAESARRNVAITRATFNDTDKTKIVDLLRGRFRDVAGQSEAIATMTARLAAEVRARGDRRIADADAVATEFFQRVTDTAAELPDDARLFVIRGLIAKNIEPGDIGPETTLGDLDDIGIFRGQLKVVAEAVGLSWAAIKGRVHPDSFPSWVIGQNLRRYGQDVPERKGSDLNDGYLLALAAYADLTLVDKRALENVRRAKTRSAEFAGLIGNVAKAAIYSEVMATISAQGGSATAMDRRDVPRQAERQDSTAG